MTNAVISCGGTGGHLAPGIALAENLLARGGEVRRTCECRALATESSPAPRVTLLISQKKIDSRLSESYSQLRFLAVPGTGFSWAPLRLLRCIVSQFQGLLFCLKLLAQERPSVVVGMGGFTSAGVALAARLLGIPLALHESNRVPGLATRMLGRIASRVYLPEGVRLLAVRPSRIRHVGLPVRREIVPQPRSAACATLGLDPTRPVLAIFGGSQGAGPLNDWTQAHLASLAAEGVQVYCVTGPGKGEAGIRELPLKATKTSPKIEANAGESEGAGTARATTIKAIFVPFCDDVATLLSAADLVVSRAGSGTIAELIRCGTPAILVPYPHAADDHQRANAAFFEKQGGGIVVEQSELGRLRHEVIDTIFNEWLLHRLRGNLRRMEREDATAVILHDLETLARE